MHPSDHRSLANDGWEPCNTSGAMYVGVPDQKQQIKLDESEKKTAKFSSTTNKNREQNFAATISMLHYKTASSRHHVFCIHHLTILKINASWALRKKTQKLTLTADTTVSNTKATWLYCYFHCRNAVSGNHVIRINHEWSYLKYSAAVQVD